MRFNNTFDKTAKTVTIFVVILILLVSFLPLIDSEVDYVFFISLTTTMSILFFSWSLHPKYYTIESDGIHIKRFFKSIHIPFESIIKIHELKREDTSGSMRLNASGGLFGYFGIFSNQKLKKYYMYATNTYKLVSIQLQDKLYVISPEERELFIAEVNKKLGDK